jgi:hypothetical protein
MICKSTSQKPNWAICTRPGGGHSRLKWTKKRSRGKKPDPQAKFQCAHPKYKFVKFFEDRNGRGLKKSVRLDVAHHMKVVATQAPHVKVAARTQRNFITLIRDYNA